MRATAPQLRAAPAARPAAARHAPPPARCAASAEATLRRAATTKAVPPAEVAAALAAARASGPRVEGAFPAALAGTWRLVFAQPAPIEAWSYIPVDEDAEIDATNGSIRLGSAIGPLAFSFAGGAEFECRPEEGVYDMHFSFTSTTIRAFGREWVRGRAGKRKTYSFFLLDGDLAAVTSSATGGSTLMLRAG
jgi:hypothetical protein